MNSRFAVLDDTAIAVVLARKHMTKRDLCKKAGIDQGNLTTMLKRGNVRPKTAGILADALGVDITEILQLKQEADHEAG